MPQSLPHTELADRLAREALAPHASDVDARGRFPREAVDAFAASGLAGLLSSPEVGGMGKGPRAAVEVVERLARSCGSTG